MRGAATPKSRASAGVEHSVRWVGTRHAPALRCQRRDRRLDDLDLLTAELPGLPRMGVEPRDRQPGLGDAEIALQSTKRRATT